MATITFANDIDTNTLRGFLQDIHGWTVTVTTKDQDEFTGAILKDPFADETVTLVPEYDLTQPNTVVNLADIVNVEVL